MLLGPMRTNYSVWEWTDANGWKFFLGSNVYDQATQVMRALKAYQPQKWYGVYGPWSFSSVSEISAQWRGTRYLWGWVSTLEHGWITIYAMSQFFPPDVDMQASGAVMNDMPQFMSSAIAMRQQGRQPYKPYG